MMDGAGFRKLFDSTYPALAKYARHRGLARDDAEDLIASTYEVAWRRVDAVPEGSEALLWLYTVAFNQLRNFRRRSHRDRDLIVRLPLMEVVPPPREPDDGVITLRSALNSLDVADRELILLIASEGLTAAQAGAIVGCGVVATRTRLHRARKRLAAALEAGRDRSPSSTTRDDRDAEENAREALT
jgi:RNA polymerase sigma-70 factor (ECF subfamily)